jgi:phospholipid/cholesterol/gamma-HCH transport system permease protein
MTSGTDSELLLWDASETPPRLNVRGNWTLENYAALGEQIALFRHRSGGLAAARRNVELGGLAALDTAGAARLYELLGAELAGELAASSPALSRERSALLLTVANAMRAAGEASEKRQRGAFIDIFGHAGVALEIFWREILALLGFMGFTLDALARGLLHPARWRMTSIVAQIHETGLNAVPIIALLNFMVGAVIAFLGATVLANFGASIYTVNLVTFAFLRELGVLLTAILMAGRTASTFTAQLGSMKINEEIDATRVLGLNPANLLVLPRVLALFVSLPILTFVGMISGILGGALVCALQLDISLAMFLTIFQDQIELRHFLVGMSKAPIFAFVIGVIGCLEGLKVSGSALSVGQHTTASVVHSIFVVIFLDAMAALFFMEMGW